MDRDRLLAAHELKRKARADDPPIIMIQEKAVTQREKRAAATNKREYDRDTGEVLSREEAAEEHRKTIKKTQSY